MKINFAFLQKKIPISKLFLGFLLSIILATIFIIASLPFMILSEGKTLEEMKRIEGINAWREVGIFGFFTLVVVFLTF